MVQLENKAPIMGITLLLYRFHPLKHVSAVTVVVTDAFS